MDVILNRFTQKTAKRPEPTAFSFELLAISEEKNNAERAKNDFQPVESVETSRRRESVTTFVPELLAPTPRKFRKNDESSAFKPLSHKGFQSSQRRMYSGRERTENFRRKFSAL